MQETQKACDHGHVTMGMWPQLAQACFADVQELVSAVANERIFACRKCHYPFGAV